MFSLPLEPMSLCGRYHSSLLEAYLDADYAMSMVDKRFATSYSTFIEGNLVTQSKKQKYSYQIKCNQISSNDPKDVFYYR